MNQSDPVAAQARLDKLMARIAFLEENNLQVRKELADAESRMQEKEKQLREAQVCNGELHDLMEGLQATVVELDQTITGLHDHMDELRKILLRDNDAQTVLDALRLLAKASLK